MGKQKKSGRLMAGLLHLLFPAKCAFCGEIVREEDNLLCSDCRRKLPYTPAGQVLREEDSYLRCSSAFYYEGALRKTFLRYKFQGRDFYGERFGDFTAKAAKKQLPGGWDLVTWAPLSKKRLKKRGYDQAKLLAEVIAEEFGLPLVPTLVKVRNTKPQSRLNDSAARAKNAKDAYAPIPGLSLAGKRVLLVDDVLTTGSTLKECAKVLRSCGAARVDCAVLARHRPKDEEPSSIDSPING